MKKWTLLVGLLLAFSAQAEYKMIFKQSVQVPIENESSVSGAKYYYDMDTTTAQGIVNRVTEGDVINLRSGVSQTSYGVDGTKGLYIGPNSDSYLDLNTIIPVVGGTSDFTLSFYVRSLGYGKYGVLLMLDKEWNNGAVTGIQMMRSGARTGRFEVNYGSDLHVSSVYPQNAYQHIIMRRGDGVLRVYIDGVLAHEGGIPSNYNLKTEDEWRLCGGVSGDNYYECYLDELKVYDFALSESEFADL